MGPFQRFAIAAASIFALVTLAASCNKHSVPLGGECDALEDCAQGAFGCVKAEGQSKGYCTMTCQVKPLPGVSGGKSCQDSGMECRKAATKHPSLGDEYCMK